MESLPALGIFLSLPSARRRRREVAAVTRLSLACHAAVFTLFTPGERFDADDIAARLRSIADDLDAVGLGVADLREVA